MTTFLEQMARAMDAEDQAAVAARIRELRGRIPQPVIAERVGIGLRAYQTWEDPNGSTPSWPNAKKLAEVHNVTPDFIYFGGDAEEEDTQAEPASSEELQAIREDLSALREEVSTIADAVTRLLDPAGPFAQALGAIGQQDASPPDTQSSNPGRRGARRAAAG